MYEASFRPLLREEPFQMIPQQRRLGKLGGMDSRWRVYRAVVEMDQVSVRALRFPASKALEPIGFQIGDVLRGNSGEYRVCRHVTRDDGSGSYDSIWSHGDAWHQCSACSYKAVVQNMNRSEMLEARVFLREHPRAAVVGHEGHVCRYSAVAPDSDEVGLGTEVAY